MNKKQIKLKFYYTQNKKSQEQLYIIDNKAKKVIFSQTFEIGDIIISIINNYNTIIHILNTYIKKVEKEILKMKKGSIALVSQITTISKQRIYDPKTKHLLIFWQT